VSLHESGQWHYAFNTDEKAAAAQLEPSDDRFIEKWHGEDGRLPGAPLRQAYAIVLGRFSLGFPPVGTERARNNVDWVEDLPPAGPHAWQFTVLVSDAGVQSTPPGMSAMGAIPVGGFVLSNGSSLWVMRHLVTLGERGWENLQIAASAVVQRLGRPTEPTVYRADLSGTERGELHWVTQVAVTANPAAPAQPT
jgi:hypothetical protein